MFIGIVVGADIIRPFVPYITPIAVGLLQPLFTVSGIRHSLGPCPTMHWVNIPINQNLCYKTQQRLLQIATAFNFYSVFNNSHCLNNTIINRLILIICRSFGNLINDIHTVNYPAKTCILSVKVRSVIMHDKELT